MSSGRTCGDWQGGVRLRGRRGFRGCWFIMWDWRSEMTHVSDLHQYTITGSPRPTPVVHFFQSL